MAIRGVLFDKDGTLFDFEATWNGWTSDMLLDLAGGDRARASDLGDRIGFDLERRRFEPDSTVIAGTPDDIVRLLGPAVPELSAAEIVNRLNDAAALVRQVEAVPLGPLLTRLRSAGLKLGVATNDAEAPARAHLAATGQQGQFDFVAGYDSGHGGKPEPGMCLAFAKAVGLPAEQIVMVGDSTHDLIAGRAAGMTCVAVLTGMASPLELAPLADAVLPDIGALPEWLDI